MKKEWMIKTLALGVIILFICMNVNPSFAVDNIKKSSISVSDGNILYVGGSGEGNYSNIQDAINNASNGDTIYVYSGIYNPIWVSKSLQIIGENKYTTILNGTGWNAQDVVGVVGGVTISGFTIQHGGTPGGNYGRGISIQHVSDVIVSDVIFTQNYLAIILYWSSNVLLDNLTFFNKGGSITFWEGRNCTITNCIFDNSGIGIEGYSPSCHGSLYIGNNLFTNNSGIGLGYLCIDSHGNTTIESNQFENNSCCISTYICQGVNVVRNNFINNTKNVNLVIESYIRQIRYYISFKQNWINNYWDDWNQNGSYTIRGSWTFYIGFGDMFTFPIFRVLYKEYDYNPAKEPYDIGG
jgi:hypothetical protein